MMNAEINGEAQEDTSVKKDSATSWVRLRDGKIPKTGDSVRCPDGLGKVDWVLGPNVQVKLDTGNLWRGGLEQIWVLR